MKGQQSALVPGFTFPNVYEYISITEGVLLQKSDDTTLIFALGVLLFRLL